MKIFSNVLLKQSKLVLHHDNSNFPENPTLGEFAIVNGALNIFTNVSGVSAWRPLTRVNQHYKHVQTIPSSTWTINHNLATEDLIVGVYDENDEMQMFSGITFTDTDNITITFTEGIAGKALIFAMSESLGPVMADFQSYTETVVDLGTKTASFEVNVKDSTIQKVVINGTSITISFTGWPLASSGRSASVVLSITNAGQNVVWPSSVKWGQGIPPELTASGTDRLIFTSDDGGTTIYGFAASLDLR